WPCASARPSPSPVGPGTAAGRPSPWPRCSSPSAPAPASLPSLTQPRKESSPMSVDLTIQRWTRDVAVRQWSRDDATLVGLGAELPESITRERSLAEVHRLDLSLFVVFEEAALRVSGALVRRAPDEEALMFAAQQTLDEARHREVFA